MNGQNILKNLLIYTERERFTCKKLAVARCQDLKWLYLHNMDSKLRTYTAVSTKVVPKKCKSVSAVSFHHAETPWGSIHSSNRKTTINHNNFRHCRVSFFCSVRQPYSKHLYRFTWISNRHLKGFARTPLAISQCACLESPVATTKSFPVKSLY